jgi:2-keto-3-deoxy-L-rhamnonate aldolase RhmA
MLRSNSAKDRLRSGKPVIGVGLTFASPAMVELCAYAGFHFVRIDCEHGPMDPAIAEHLIRTAEATGITPLVRPPANQSHEILRYLDAGAQGVLVPHIETKEDAERAARAVRFHPHGDRSMGGTRWAQYGAFASMTELAAQSNEAMFMMALIESKAGVDNLDEILAVEGVDAVQIGPNDLSQSLGLPAQVNEPVVREYMDRIIDKTVASGKYMALGAGSVESAKRLLDRGVMMIELSVTQIFLDSARGMISDIGIG